MVVMGYVVDVVVDGGNKPARRSSSPMRTRTSSTTSCTPWTAAARACWRRARGPRRTVRSCSSCLRCWGKISIIKTIVYEHDANAMLIITDVNEAIGYGFKSDRLTFDLKLGTVPNLRSSI